MTRNMKRANRALFEILEKYCVERGQPISSAGAVRYIKGDATAQNYLKILEIGPILKFGHHRSLSRLRADNEHFIALLGFEFESGLRRLTLIDSNPGISVCLLSEVGPRPIARPVNILNTVEASSADEPGYSGHDSEQIESLFPAIQVFRCDQPIDDDSAWRLFLMLSVEECQRGESWIDDDLANAILALTDLNIPSLPYAAISRSIFDLDPQSLYMALYRCIEATYAYESCRKLVNRLALSASWLELAVALESEVGWHPQEASSLNLVLRHALEKDLEEVCQCLGADSKADLHVDAGRAIYRLRNRIVHFRPGGEPVDVDSINWNRLCKCLVSIVFTVFSHAYS